MRTKPVCLAVAVTTVLLLSAVCAAPPAGWSPNKTVLGQLAPATGAGGYQIQPPKGYALQTQPGPGGSTSHAWVGAPHADGTRSYVMLIVLTPPTDEEDKYTLEQVSAKMLAGGQQRRKDWKQSPSETGTVNGTPFVRTYWQDTDAGTGMVMRGFSYVAHEGKRFLQLSSQDVEPYAKTSLPLAEAAVLTFKKQDKKNPVTGSAG